MVAIKNVLLVVTAVAAVAIHKRSTAQVLSDIATIDSDVKSLTSAINAYKSIDDAAVLISTENALENALEKATSDTNSTPGPVSESDASKVIAAIKKLNPDVKAALKAAVAKKSAFVSSGIATVVEDDLENLKNETDAFASALISKTPVDKQPQAVTLKEQFDSEFDTALAAYSS